MPTVLLLMSMGGLVIVPTLNYTTTMLRSSQVMERDRNGFYSADAGVEHGLHLMKNNPPATYPHSYSISTLNGLSTTVLIERLTTLYGIVIGESGVHAGDLEAAGSMVYNEGLGRYVYTVTVTNKAGSVVHFNKLLVKPPVDFSYVPGTTSGQITSAEPEVKGVPSTGITLVWNFSQPLPSIPQAPDPENGQYSYKTNTLHLTGPQGYSGGAGYVWVVANREDIGAAGTDAYSITATARQGTTVVAGLKAGVLIDPGSGEIFVIYYEQNSPSP